jgi:hypothetical protein
MMEVQVDAVSRLPVLTSCEERQVRFTLVGQRIVVAKVVGQRTVVAKGIKGSGGKAPVCLSSLTFIKKA